jgi:hypothetical protein
VEAVVGQVSDGAVAAGKLQSRRRRSGRRQIGEHRQLGEVDAAVLGDEYRAIRGEGSAVRTSTRLGETFDS